MPDFTGQSLGRYHILEQLGEGGMATVYKAFDTRLERDVAVKIIRLDQFAPAMLERVLKRFEREAKALARLTHPNIVHVNDYGEHEGIPYLVMDYVPGGTLKQSLGKPMPWQRAVRLLLPIAEALAFAHEHNIIHRDIKPSNILLTEKGQPMLSDFGIAKILESEETAGLTGTGMGLGTPEYMAPEQWTGQAGPLADLYSLGVVLYELVTGRKPYAADTPAAIMLKQANDPLPRPRQFAPDLPEAMEKMLIKALAKRPIDRYQSMSEFATAIESLAASSIASTELSPSEERTLDALGPPTGKIPLEEESQGGHTSKSRLFWLAGGIGILIIGVLCISGLVLLIPKVINKNQVSLNATETLPVTVPQATPTIIALITETPSARATITPQVTWSNGRLVYLVRNSHGRNDIYMLDLTKDNPPKILLTPTSNQQYYGPWLSPDSKRLVYYNYNGGDSIMDLQTQSSLIDFGLCNSPTFSPDGSKIICGDTDSQFLILDSNGRQIGFLKTNLNGLLPNWSPDGTLITFSTIDGNHSSIWKISISGGQPIQLANEPGENYGSTWSPDGKQIAYQAGPFGHSDIWVMDSDGGNKRQITNTPGGWSHAPSWSPNGNWLVFVSTQAGSVDADFGEIFITSLESGVLHQITHTGGSVYDWRVTWGP